MDITKEAKKRRLQDTLIIAGYGVIAFSVWSLAKTGLFLFLADDDAIRQYFSVDDTYPLMMLFITTAIIICIDVAVRAFVGLSARSEGRGKKKNPLYLIIAIFCGLLNAISAIGIALGIGATTSIMDSVISVIIETTSLTALVLVVYCSISLRRLNKAAE